jgi:D-glycero-alpha-D-manno-heptose-7-phosphate kinase
VIEVSVPVRVCDIGGWTDTWFGSPGRVLNVAVRPGIDVTISAIAASGRVLVDVGDDAAYAVVPGAPRAARSRIVEAAIDILPPPADVGLAVRVRSAVPPACAVGTSAAVAVALLAGLAAARSESLSRRQVASLAHRLEVDVLGLQSGVQDQLSVAFGGINYLEIDNYPDATRQHLGTWPDLDARLTTLFVGHAHESSRIHQQVIEHLARHPASMALAALRTAATAARDAVLARNLYDFGQSMIANTEAQRMLHPELIGADATRAIECAARQGALGWKVNGAGGNGGSVTILHPTQHAKDIFEDRVTRLDERYRVLPGEIANIGLDCKGILDDTT